MKRISWLVFDVLLVLFLVIYAFPLSTPAVSATSSFEAISQAPWEWTDFSVVWTDDNQDGLLQLSELATDGFSGVTYLPFTWFYESLEAVPVWSSQSPFTGGTEAEWHFGGQMGSVTADPSLWSYSGSISPTPLPASALLMGSGLLGLSLLSWRRRKR